MEYMEFHYKAVSDLIDNIDGILIDDAWLFRTKVFFNCGLLKEIKREDDVLFLVYSKNGAETQEELLSFDTHELNIIYDMLCIEQKSQMENDKRLETGICSLRTVDGDTHGTPALIESLTDVPLFFQSFEDYSVVPVNCDIDSFADKDGQFVVYAEDYELAMWQIYAHDVLNILSE